MITPPPDHAATAPSESTALLTDHYELTMLAGALRDGGWSRSCVFELFARRLPSGRRYGVVAGTGRFIEALDRFRFDDDQLADLSRRKVVDADTLAWLADYRFGGDIDGYAEGELYFPDSPILTVRGTFAEAVILETLALSIYNHDSAVASAAARMVSAAAGRRLIEMGSRRTHEQAAVAAARAAYLAGFDATSNLRAGQLHGVPTTGTAAHSFTLLHADERDAFRAQIAALGLDTTLLVDTYDITRGISNAIEVAGPALGGVRIDSGDLGVLARQARAQLDALGAGRTRIIVSGDLDEYAIAGLRADPIDGYGVGTSVVTGSGAPAADMVYKLVEVDGGPVAKRSPHKPSRGGRKSALRRHKPTGTATAEVIFHPDRAPEREAGDRPLCVPLVRAGRAVDPPDLSRGRELTRAGLGAVPWEGLSLSSGDPAIPTLRL